MGDLDYTKLEMTFEKAGEKGYRMSMGLRAAGSDTDKRISPTNIPLNPAELNDLRYEMDQYAKTLTRQVFDQENCRTLFAKAQVYAEVKPALRIQIVISPDAPELQGIVWEALLDPQVIFAQPIDDQKKDNEPERKPIYLATMGNIWLSRYLVSPDAPAISLRPKAEFKAVGLASNPSDLPEKMARVDAEGEIKRLRDSLAGIPITTLGIDNSPRASLDNLLQTLRPGVDVLYMACHGELTASGPVLYLQNNDGKTDRLPADKLIEGLMGLEKLPRLIVLASCESAGKEDPSALNRADSALTALGPRLSDIGVPAVLAMHGSISMATVNLFMPAFFNELSSDGRVDHALSVARNQAQLHDRYDAWMPVLFTRSISGRLWPDPSQTGPTAEQMESLINEMQSLKDRPAGGINIQGEHISIEGGVNYGAGVNQPAAPAPVKVEPVESAKTPAKAFYLDLQAVRNSRANVEMDDLLDQPREYMYLRSFVGRSYEYQKFKDLIVTELNRREKRIVAYYGKEGMGKSTLLDRIQFECLRHSIPYARVNFESGNYNNVIEIMRVMAFQLGKDEFSEWIKNFEKWNSIEEVTIKIKSDESLANTSAQLSMQNASITGGVNLGANVDMRGVQINAKTLAANDPEGAKRTLKDIFVRVLGEFVKDRPVVMLLEGLDDKKFSDDARNWLIQFISNDVRNLKGQGVLTIVTFLKRPHLENSLEDDIDEAELGALNEEEIKEYFKRKKVPDPLIEPEAKTTYVKTRGIPSQVARIAWMLLNPKRKVTANAGIGAAAAAVVQKLPAAPATSVRAEVIGAAPVPVETNTNASMLETAVPTETIPQAVNPSPEPVREMVHDAPVNAVMSAAETDQAVEVSPEHAEGMLQDASVRAVLSSVETEPAAEVGLEPAREMVQDAPVSARESAVGTGQVAEVSPEPSRDMVQEAPDNLPESAVDTFQDVSTNPALETVPTYAQSETIQVEEKMLEPEVPELVNAETSTASMEVEPQAAVPTESQTVEFSAVDAQTGSNQEAEQTSAMPEQAAVVQELVQTPNNNAPAAAAASNDEAKALTLESVETDEDDDEDYIESMMDQLLSEGSPLVAQSVQKSAVLRWFSLETIRNITDSSLSEQQAADILDEMLDWGVTQNLGDSSYVFRKESGVYLRNRLRTENPGEFRATVTRAHEYFNNQLAGVNLNDEMAWANLSASQVTALREKFYYLLRLDLDASFDLLRSLFQSAQRLQQLGEVSTLIRFAQDIDQVALPVLYKNRLQYYEIVLKASSGSGEAALQGINDLLNDLDGGILDVELKAQLLGQLGTIFRDLKDGGNAVLAFEQAQGNWRGIGRPREVARLFNNIGLVYNSQRVFDKAEKAFKDALSEYKKAGSTTEYSSALNNLGNVFTKRGEWTEALDNYQKSLSVKQKSGDQHGAALTLVNMGGVYGSMPADGNVKKQAELRAKAMDYFEAAFELFKGLGAQARQADVLYRQALLLNQGGQTDLAREKFGEAVQIYKSLRLWVVLESAEFQKLAEKLAYKITIEAHDRPVTEEKGTKSESAISALDVLQRLIKTKAAPVSLTPKPAQDMKKTAAVKQAPAPKPAQAPKPVAVEKPAPAVMPAQARKEPPSPLQKLDESTDAAVLANIKTSFAGLNPSDQDIIMHAAVLRLVDAELLAVISPAAGAKDTFGMISKLPFVESHAQGQVIYKQGEQAYLRTDLKLEKPEQFNDIIRRLVEHFDQATGGLEKLKASRELPLPEVFTGLCEELYYRLEGDLPDGIKFLDGLVTGLVEKTGQFKMIGSDSSHASVNLILAEASAVLDFTRESGLLPAGEQDRLTYYEAWMDNIAGRQEQAETKLQALNKKLLSDEPRALVLGQLGIVDTNKGEIESAIRSFEQAQAIWVRLKRDMESAKVSNNLGTACLRNKDFAKAEKSFQQALTIFNKIGSPADQSQTMNNLGNLYSGMENWDKALEHYQKSLDLKKTIGDQFGAATTLNNLGRIYQRQAQLAQGSKQTDLLNKAVSAYHEAIEIFRKFGARALLGRAVFALSYLYAQSGQADQARKILPEALQIFKEQNMPELANAAKLGTSLGLK